MAGYYDTYNMIINTLMGRASGTEIQPENHQEFALNLLNYVRSLELLANAPFIGIAESTTQPVQPDGSRACYIAGIAQDRTVTFHNFYDSAGKPISITTDEMEAYLIILVWNAQYWSMEKIPTNIISSADKAYFTYNLTIKKTYNSVSSMNADRASPIGNDGKYIKVGEIVSVHNEDASDEDAIYSWEGGAWKLQTRLSAVNSRVFDGGCANTKYGGARNVDAGDAQG